MKGRDWYDLIWYVARSTPIHLTHLRQRLIQSQAWQQNKELTRDDLRELLAKKIKTTDFDNAKKDIAPFIVDQHALDLWSQAFFLDLISKIKIATSDHC
ncbi:MAG: hypothetical protein P1U34_03085 [Coxiellaceae bacterium]|nr:hypothetical protein [Coxiellaceae bacterium]